MRQPLLPLCVQLIPFFLESRQHLLLFDGQIPPLQRLLLGVGFVVGGYCPGTSIVALSTGRLDAVAFLAGITVGIFVFGELYPALESFVNADALGRVTLPEFFGLDTGKVVFAVVLMALLGFWGSSVLERKMGDS